MKFKLGCLVKVKGHEEPYYISNIKEGKDMYDGNFISYELTNIDGYSFEIKQYVAELEYYATYLDDLTAKRQALEEEMRKLLKVSNAFILSKEQSEG